MNNKARRAWGALLLANLFVVPMVLADLDPVQQSALDAQAARLKATIDADIETLECDLCDVTAAGETFADWMTRERLAC